MSKKSTATTATATSTIATAAATVAKSNLSAAGVVMAKLLGKAAVSAIFDNPTVKDTLIVAGAVNTIAALADSNKTHGALLNDISFGMSLHAADEVLRACEEADVFKDKDVKYAAEDVADVFVSPQLLDMIRNAKEGERLFCTAASTPIVAAPNAVDTPKAEAPAATAPKAEATKDKAKVISGPAVDVKIPVATKPAAPAKVELVCAVCGTPLTKEKDKVPFLVLRDGYESAEELKYDNKLLCAKHRDRFVQDHTQRKAADERQQKKEDALVTEIEELKGKIATETQGVAQAKEAVALVEDKDIRASISKTIEDRQLCVSKTARLLGQKENQLKQLRKSSQYSSKASK